MNNSSPQETENARFVLPIGKYYIKTSTCRDQILFQFFMTMATPILSTRYIVEIVDALNLKGKGQTAVY